MAIASLRISAPKSPYRDCDITLVEAADPTAAISVMCTDAETGLIIGSPSIASNRCDYQRNVGADEVIRLIGGTYRLASVAVDIGAQDLARRSRRITDELRLAPRLWRRKRRRRGS